MLKSSSGKCVTLDVPPEMADKDFKEIRDASIVSLFTQWKEKKLLLDQIQAQVEALREKILSSVELPRVRCAGVQLMRMSPQGCNRLLKNP